MKIDANLIKDLFKYRDENANKYDFGVVGIMGGCVNFSGAIKLASMSLAAMRSGAGLTRVIVPKDIVSFVTPYLVEQTLFPIDSNINDAIKNIDVLAVGMGWGVSNENEEYLKYILDNFTGVLIIDADGLNILASNLELLNDTQVKIVLTPHLKEFSRLINKEVTDIKENPEKYALEFAKKYGVIALLKGHETIVTDGNITYLVDVGSPGMATAGSGDVLSGILAGFLGYNEYNVLSVAAGAYLAGLAGSLATQKYTDIAMIASDTIKYIPDAIKIIRGEYEKN